MYKVMGEFWGITWEIINGEKTVRDIRKVKNYWKMNKRKEGRRTKNLSSKNKANRTPNTSEKLFRKMSEVSKLHLLPSSSVNDIYNHKWHYICIYKYIHMHVHEYVHIYEYVYMCIYICIRKYIERDEVRGDWGVRQKKKQKSSLLVRSSSLNIHTYTYIYIHIYTILVCLPSSVE